MNNAMWWEGNEGGVHVSSTDSAVPLSRALPPTGLIYSARMSGQEMRNSDGVFTQFYEALRLPDYFGWNWEALTDCLRDLHWIDATHFLITIDDADAVLSEDPGEREILFRGLKDAARFWAGKAELPGHKKTTFEVVLLGPSDAQDEMRRELQM